MFYSWKIFTNNLFVCVVWRAPSGGLQLLRPRRPPTPVVTWHQAVRDQWLRPCPRPLTFPWLQRQWGPPHRTQRLLRNTRWGCVLSPKTDFYIKQFLFDTRPLPVSVFLAGEVQAFQEDLNGKLYINEVYKFSVDKLYDILFTESQFMREFLEQRRFSGWPTLSSSIYPAICLSIWLLLIWPFSSCRCGLSTVEERRHW